MLALRVAFNITPQQSQAEHVGVFSKLGGMLLGWIVKPRIDFDLSRKDTSILLRDMQRHVGRFFKHPCRSFRHIVLFAGSVQLVPDEFAYDTDLSSTNLAELHSELRMATRVEAILNYDDGPACRAIVASRLDINVVKSELRVTMQPFQRFERDVLLMPALDLVNSNDVECVQAGWSRDNNVKLSCLKSPRPIKSVMLFHYAETFGDMQCFEQAETLAIRSPGRLAKLDGKDLEALSKSMLTTMELILLSWLPNQIGLMTRLTSLKVVHTDESHDKRDEYLNGWYNFDTIPSELGLLTNLATLGLSGPGFQGDVPSQLGRLCNLKELVITDTWATRLPTELGELASLQRLNLSRNSKLRNLPSQVGQLGTLQWMDVSQSIGVQNYDVMKRGTWHAYKQDMWRDRLDFERLNFSFT